MPLSQRTRSSPVTRMKPSPLSGAKTAPVSRVSMPAFCDATDSDGFVMVSAVIAECSSEILSTLDYSGASEEQDLTGRWVVGAVAVLCAGVLGGPWSAAAGQGIQPKNAEVNAPSYSFQDTGAAPSQGAGDKETVMTKQQAKELFCLGR